MKVKATEEDIADGLNGGCTACGEIQYGNTEPDAREYKCEDCGQNKVYGLEELIVMGLIDLIGDFDDE